MEQPITREEQFLAKAAGEDVQTPEPITRAEQYLAKIAEGGGQVDPEEIKQDVEDWLEDNIDPETGYVIDNTLSIANAAADAKAVGDELTDVKSAITLLNNRKNLNIFEQGGISSSTGGGISSDTRIRTSEIIPSETTEIQSTTGYLFAVFAYNITTGAYAGYLTTNDTIALGGSVAWVNKYVPTTLYNYKIVLKKTNESNILPAEYTNAFFSNRTDHDLTEENIPADAKATGERLTSAEGNITKLLEGYTSGEIVIAQKNGLTDFTYGKAINGSGEYVDANGSFATQQFISVSSDEYTVASELSLVSTSIDIYHYIACYNSSKQFIGRIGGKNIYTIAETLLENTAFIRISLTYVGETNVESYKLKVYLPMASGGVNPYLYKKTGIILGDSISYGLYSYWDGDDRKNSDGLTPDYAPVRISDYFAQLAGMSMLNIAKRGTGYVADTRGLGNALAKATSTNFSSYDFVGLCFGINDYIQNATIGTINDNTEGTVVGNLIRVLRKIYTDNPLAKVVIFSPYNAWGQVAVGGSGTLYGDESTNYALGYANSAGYTLQDLVDAIDEVANHFGVTHEKLNKSNIVNRINIKDIMIDGLHPSLESLPMLAAEMFAQKDFG